MADAAGAQRLVAGAGARWAAHAAERPLLEGAGQPAVADVAGGHGSAGAAGPGDGRGAGVVLACPGVSELAGRVTGFGQGPGAEDDAKTGLAGVALSVRVIAKMGGHHLA